VIFNLHVSHDEAGLRSGARAFRTLIDLGMHYGRQFITSRNHRWATRRQLETCYPQFREFLAKKLAFDPTEVFQSDWYAHTQKLTDLVALWAAW
jgi:hypothetical protein